MGCWRSGQLVQEGETSYSYDLAGNRDMTVYQTGQSNQLLSDGQWRYAYDGEGNVTSKESVTGSERWTYEYGHRNELVPDRIVVAVVAELRL